MKHSTEPPDAPSRALSAPQLELTRRHRHRHRVILKSVVAALGFFVGLFTVFMILFLYRVLPHGGF